MPAVASHRRTLYHSKLREFGPVVAEFSSKPRPSKFPGKPEYCHVVINGQELEYQCETPEIATQLQDVPLRTPVRIEALGSKDAAVRQWTRAKRLASETLYPPQRQRPASRTALHPLRCPQRRRRAPAATGRLWTLRSSLWRHSKRSTDASRPRLNGRLPRPCTSSSTDPVSP